MESGNCFGFFSLILSFTLLIFWTKEISALKQGHQISILLANAICNYTQIPQAVKLALSPDYKRGIRVQSKRWEGDSWGFLHKKSSSRSSSRFNLILEEPEESKRRIKRQAGGKSKKLVCFQGTCDHNWEADGDYPECVIAYYNDKPTDYYAQGYFDGFCYPNAVYCDFCYTAKCNNPGKKSKSRCNPPHPAPPNKFDCYMGNCDSWAKVHSNLPECATATLSGGARYFYPQNKKIGYCRDSAEKCQFCAKSECNDPSKAPSCGNHPPPPPPPTPDPNPPPYTSTTPRPPPPGRPCQKKALVLGLKSQVDFEVVSTKVHNSSLYALIIRPELPWVQAMYACATHGMTLTDVRNLEELNFLNGFLYDNVDTMKPSVEIWIGGNRFRGGLTKREAKWFEGDQVIQESAWNDGEGNDKDKKENCVLLENKNPPQFKATDTVCEKCLPFICKSTI